MWTSTPSFSTLARPRVLLAAGITIASLAAAGYYAYNRPALSTLIRRTTLRRNNAIRRSNRRLRASDDDDYIPEQSEEDAADGVDRVIVESDGSEDELEGQDIGYDDAYDPISSRAGHNIVGLLFRVSEDNARRNSWVHRGCQCNSCNTVPIRGIRYRCANCADFDLCESCEAQGLHNKAHVFYKIKVPVPPSGPRTIQPVLYTGDPENCNKNLPKSTINRLCQDTGFDRAMLESQWERWTFLANTEWREDPDDLCIAMDRKTFDRCIVHTGNGAHFPPNLVHDRMFAFFDQNNDGLISFREYLLGLGYRNQKDRLKRVFQGYDVDGDGYVDRKDFLRMFRAYFSIFKQIHKDILEGIDMQVLSMTEAQHIINGRTPISGFFGREENMPRVDRRDPPTLSGKTLLADGSVRLPDGVHGVVDPSSFESVTRAEVLQAVFSVAAIQEPTRNGQILQHTLPSSLLYPPTDLRAILNLVTRLNGEPNGPRPTPSAPGPASDAAAGATANRLDSLENSTDLPEPARELQKRMRKQINERWKKRMFYLDVEEGAVPPPGVNEDEDIVDAIQAMVNPDVEEDDTPIHRPMSTRSRSSSKVRFVDDGDDVETRSNASTSSRSIPERWGGFDIPEAERDCGKEILYLTAQEAFNELLNVFFKSREDLALRAAETREIRNQYRQTLDMMTSKNETQPKHFSHHQVDENDPNHSPGITHDDLYTATFGLNNDLNHDAGEHVDGKYRDPTMPQFKPEAADEENEECSSAGGSTTHKKSDVSKPLTLDNIPNSTLRKWRKYHEAEAEAVKRRGFGKINFAEFEKVYRQYEKHHRIDYLETWLDICMI